MKSIKAGRPDSGDKWSQLLFEFSSETYQYWNIFEAKQYLEMGTSCEKVRVN